MREESSLRDAVRSMNGHVVSNCSLQVCESSLFKILALCSTVDVWFCFFICIKSRQNDSSDSKTVLGVGIMFNYKTHFSLCLALNHLPGAKILFLCLSNCPIFGFHSRLNERNVAVKSLKYKEPR